MTGPPRAALVALSLWAAVFGAPHVYWAAGGRAGLGAETAAADAALATPWFAAYNGLTALACVLGVTVCATELAGRTRLLPRLRLLLLVLAVLLALRGLVGIAGLVVAAFGPGIDSPPILIAVEGWFLLGAGVLAWLWRDVSTRSLSGPAGSTQPGTARPNE